MSKRFPPVPNLNMSFQNRLPGIYLSALNTDESASLCIHVFFPLSSSILETQRETAKYSKAKKKKRSKQFQKMCSQCLAALVASMWGLLNIRSFAHTGRWVAMCLHWSSFPCRSQTGQLLCFLAFATGCCLVSQWAATGCLPTQRTQDFPLEYVQAENHFYLCLIPLTIGVKTDETPCKGNCVYVSVGVRGRGGSLLLGELIQRICSASRRERALIGMECATHLQGDTHTARDFVNLTYRWVFKLSWSKIRDPKTNSTSSSDWCWRMRFARRSQVTSAAKDPTVHHLDFIRDRLHTSVCYLPKHMQKVRTSCLFQICKDERNPRRNKEAVKKTTEKQKNLFKGEKKKPIYLFKLVCLSFN